MFNIRFVKIQPIVKNFYCSKKFLKIATKIYNISHYNLIVLLHYLGHFKNFFYAVCVVCVKKLNVSCHMAE